jgi:hypothetical protein
LTKKLKVGRPTKSTPEITEAICDWIAEGKSLRSFCAKHKGDEYPALSTITRWIVGDDEFRAQYACAREAAGFAHADHIVDIVNDCSDMSVPLDAARARVALDGLKWSAERMAPKSHLVRTEMDLISSDGSMSPKPTEIVLRGVKAEHDDGDD